MKRLFLSQAPLLTLVAMAAVFAALTPSFRTSQNMVNIFVQSSSSAILAAGMTFVLLTAGIDLSVGAVMFLGAAVCGKLIGLAVAPWLAVLAMVMIGPLCGLGHGLLITRGGMSPFIVTLGSLFFIRGTGLWVSRTRAMNLPDMFTQLASMSLLYLPLPVWLAALTIGALHFVLTFTPFGRQTLAVGHDPGSARKAGVQVRRILIGVYVISGTCAALGGLAMLAQLGAVSPTFGKDREEIIKKFSRLLERLRTAPGPDQNAEGAIAYFTAHSPKGEFTLVLKGAEPTQKPEWTEDVILKELQDLIGSGVSRSDASRQLAELADLPRRQIYQLALTLAAE